MLAADPVGVAVADRRAGPHPAYATTSGAVSVIAGRRRRRPARVDADQAGADPAHRVVAPRVGQGRGGRGEVALPPGAARRRGRSPGPTRTGCGPGRCTRRPGRRLQPRWPISADHLDLAALLGAPGGAAQPRPGGGGGAVAGHARRRGAGGPGARPGAAATTAQVLEPGTATSTSAPTASAKSASTGLSQLSTGASSPASRSGQASARLVTPSEVAPCASAVRATSSAPWPNPSALTTAISEPVARAASRRVLCGDRREVDVEPRAAARRARAGRTAGSSCRRR